MAGGKSHLWADEVDQEDAAKGIPPPEKFQPPPEWRGGGGSSKAAEPRAFAYQPVPDTASSLTPVSRPPFDQSPGSVRVQNSRE